jgi:hypothetical protein
MVAGADQAAGSAQGRVKRFQTVMLLVLLTAGSLLVHGYHPFAEDAEIYLPGIERILNPNLFPMGREFFTSHASLTIFPNLMAFFLRVTHLPMEAALFLCHLLSILLLLRACWELSSKLFPSFLARWGSVCLVAALLTLPVAGTALYIFDQYLNPRNLAAFAEIFAVARTLDKKYVRAGLWIVFAVSVHPLMASFAFSYCALLVVMGLPGIEKFKSRAAGAEAFGVIGALCCLLPFGISLDPPTSRAYHEAAMRHGFHYIQLWQWYEILGAVAPLALFAWFGRMARAREWHDLNRVCRALVVYGVIYFFAALVVDLPLRFESLARLQPLRSLHLLYMLMVVVMGGLLGEFVLKNRVWRWLVLFVPLSAGTFIAQRELFPASAHIEWPGRAPKNPWAEAFVWIRSNTPQDAVFALDPGFLQLPGEDATCFRCLTQRSRLADVIKDSGAVSMFPPLAEEWWAQVQAQTPWRDFRAEDFIRLKEKYGVSWVVVQQPRVAGLDCPFQNHAVQVCHLP